MNGRKMSKASKLANLDCKTKGYLAESLDTQSYTGLLAQLHPDWEIQHNDHPKLVREFTFKDYEQTLAFINSAAGVAIKQDHHPKITFTWNKCIIDYHTHSCNDLSLKDFICAYRIDHLG